MEVFRDSAMNVLRRKGISGRGQPVILAQLRLRLQKAPKQNALRLHSRLHSLTGRLSENSKDNYTDLGASYSCIARLEKNIPRAICLRGQRDTLQEQ
jgi:hypothetical protein